jgi:hypothetical protein
MKYRSVLLKSHPGMCIFIGNMLLRQHERKKRLSLITLTPNSGVDLVITARPRAFLAFLPASSKRRNVVNDPR